jgi:PEP-CTERM motif
MTTRHLLAAAAAALLAGHAAAGPFDGATKAWTHAHAAGSGYLSEIVSFDALSRTLWVAGVSGVDVLDAATGIALARIDTAAWGSINSVAIHNGVAAFAMENAVRSNNGSVVLFDTSTRSLLAGTSPIAVGPLPDMLAFTPDGSRLLVANEGTPNCCSPSQYGTLAATSAVGTRSYNPAPADPVGSVSIIDMGSRTLVANATLAGVATVGSHLRTSTGMDFEPEYVAIDATGSRAWVTLQEANGVGLLNLQTASFEKIVGLGAKDFAAPGNRIDPLNDGVYGASTTLVNVDAKGLYMPDGIAAYRAGGETFLVLANEGDFREDDVDRSAASSFGVGASDLRRNLRVSNADSSTLPGELYAAGGRSFSIRDADGGLVYDSGEILDREAMILGIYNDTRSRDKGVEPEGVELMSIGGRTYAVIGLERTTESALAIFDITDPRAVSFVKMLKTPGDVSPEGLEGFVLGGFHYIAYANEVSNTTTVIQLAPVPEPATYGLMGAGLALVAAAARRRRR